jgi:hypothetical protein
VRGSSPRVDEGELAQAANKAARQRAVNRRRQAIMYVILILEQIGVELYPSTGRGAMLVALKR